MSTLARINGEALSVTGLTFRGYADRDMDRVSVICEDQARELGAIEVWCFASQDDLGGVEVHSRTALYDWSKDPAFTDCPVLDGACWTDGSMLAYRDEFLPLIRARESREVLTRIASRWNAQFGSKRLGGGQ